MEAAQSAWSGGGSPYAVNSKKLGMWLFIASDALTFSALLMAYTYLRLSTPDCAGPTPSCGRESVLFLRKFQACTNRA